MSSIVIIHGFQGHPFKTWAYPAGSQTPTSPVTPWTGKSVDGKNGRPKYLGRLTRRWSRKSTEDPAGTHRANSNDNNGVFEDAHSGTPNVFWPGDLLHEECPDSRILLYGYDTKVMKVFRGAANRGSIYSHSKNLLFDLVRARPVGRPLIFVAHSLGGVVVKEVSPPSSEVPARVLIPTLRCLPTLQHHHLVRCRTLSGLPRQ